MLAQSTTLIPYRPFEVGRILTGAEHGWSVPLDGDGGQLLAQVGISIGKIPIYKRVRLELGNSDAVEGHNGLMLPVSWTAVGGPPLFPRMEGILHVDPYGAESSRLTLNARYDPPMGALGDLIDRALMHRLAQSTMDDFMARLAASVTRVLRHRTVEQGAI